jgi:predicted protein tyrosine phosphatase
MGVSYRSLTPYLSASQIYSPLSPLTDTTMSHIHICSLKMVEPLATEIGPSHVLSLLGGITPFPETPKGIDPRHHLKITLADIAEPQEGMIHPGADHVQQVIAFAEHWAAKSSGKPIIVHCFAGISRSTASALTIACVLRPKIAEARFTEALRAASQSAQPNALLIEHADRLLGRQGRLIAAVENMGLADFSKAGQPFMLPLNL